MSHKLRTAALVTAAVVALTGCTAAQPSESDTATIEFVWAQLTAEEKAVWETNLIEPFEAANPEIDIDFQPLADADTALKVRLASGNAPDVFMTDAFTVATYEESGLLLNLDEYVEAYGWDEIIFPWAMTTGQVDGGQYAIPMEFEATLLMYNEDLLDELGVSVPTTREEFVAACEAAQAAGIIPIAYGNAGLILLNQWLYEKYLTNYAGVNAVVEVFNGEGKLTDPDIRASFALLNEDWQSGWISEKNSAALSIDQARALWYGGDALFNAEGTWIQSNIATTNPDFTWGATSWPSMKDGVPSASGVGVGSVLGVSQATEHPDEVAKFINYLYTRSPELYGQGLSAGLAPLSAPLDESALPTDMDPNSLRVIRALSAVSTDTDNVSYVPWTFYPPDTNAYLMNNLDKVFYGETDLDSYLAEAQTILDTELAAGFKFAIE